MVREYSLIPNDMLKSMFASSSVTPQRNIDEYIINSAQESMSKILGSKKDKTEESRRKYIAQLHNLKKSKKNLDVKPPLNINLSSNFQPTSLVHESAYGLESEVPIPRIRHDDLTSPISSKYSDANNTPRSAKSQNDDEEEEEFEKSMVSLGSPNKSVTFSKTPSKVLPNFVIDADENIPYSSIKINDNIPRRATRSRTKRVLINETELLTELVDSVLPYIFNNEKRFGVYGNNVINNNGNVIKGSNLRDSVESVLRGYIGAEIEGKHTPGTGIISNRLLNDGAFSDIVKDITSKYTVPQAGQGKRGRKPKPKIEKRGRPKKIISNDFFRREIWQNPKR